MKRSTILLVILALLFSLLSCSENTENGETIFFGDIEVPGDAECQILVSGPFNDSTYFALPSQTSTLSGDELDKIEKSLCERRTEYMKSLHPPKESVLFSRPDGQTDSLKYERAFMLNAEVAYSYVSNDCEIFVTCLAGSDQLRSYLNHFLMKQKGDTRIVSNIDEAISYAFDFAKSELDLYKADEYKIYRVQVFPYEDGHSIYEVRFKRLYKGILTDVAEIRVNDHYGVVGWVSDGGQKCLDFKDACIDFATEKLTDDAVFTALQNASRNTDVAEIKNAQLYYMGTDSESFYELVRGQTLTMYKDKMCGAMSYSYALDKTEVHFYYDYTAVMKDGSEKQGCNVISVFLPIDWAEVYGEKESA